MMGDRFRQVRAFLRQGMLSGGALRRPSRRSLIAAAGMVVILAGLTVLFVKPSSGLTGRVVSGPELSSPRYFTPERLEAYSGHDFNLLPALTQFLDFLEEHLKAAPVSGPTYSDYTRFINPDFVGFENYAIQPRENYWIVAKRRGYTIDTIVGCNPHLTKVVCYQGQKILLPTRGGSLHCVAADETLDTIALMFGVKPEAILEANLIDPKWGVIPGMWLFVPGAKPRHLTEGMYKEYAKRSLFRSPLSGRYSSFFGRRIHPILGFSKGHNGVDIAAKHGAWVGAAASGTVIYAGWGGAIGQYIKVDHHNGYQTVYGHLSKIRVRTGQKVRGGQLIGNVGSTGRSTGPHLHFTIYVNGAAKNPMDFLW